MRRFASLLLLMVCAGSARAQTVRVGAFVMPYLTYSVTGLPESIDLSDADVERGFIDIDRVVLNVRTNDTAGYVVVFRVDATDVVSVDIDGASSFGRAGTFMIRSTPAIDRFSFRIHLSAGAKSGKRPIPLRIAVHRLSA